MQFFEKNSLYLEPEILAKLKNQSFRGKNLPDRYQILSSKKNEPILEVDGISLHSKQNAQKEAERLAGELPRDQSERLYLFFGAGLGYIVKAALNRNPLAKAIWMEQDPDILYLALDSLDFSDLLSQNRIQFLLAPISEDELYKAFKGFGTTPTTFIPHRGSLQLDREKYQKLHWMAENFFHKKDVNLATLIRFENLWTRNLLQNLSELPGLNPISRLFHIAQDIPAMIIGAGPSLARSIESLKKFQDQFLLIAVDTAAQVLETYGIRPDLIYSVDPQVLNSYYLENLESTPGLVFDPTSTPLTIRNSIWMGKGFTCSSPFPLIQIIESVSDEELGSVPFGGSVSTNAYSLAKLMGCSPIYFVGQDLGFSDGLAHCKGATLEERLNWKESRRFRREFHNFKQLTALPKLYEPSWSGEKLQTNEKLVIFRNWFRDNAQDSIHLTESGLEIPGLKRSNFEVEFSANLNESELINRQKQIRKVKNSIENLALKPLPWVRPEKLYERLVELESELNAFLPIVQEGADLSANIYERIQNQNENPKQMSSLIQRMDQIDEIVSSKKSLSEILSLSLQRVIYSVTEGFESQLSPEEKSNKYLGISKKSVLLYSGLRKAILDLNVGIKRATLRIRIKNKVQ
jgi:hypothetical protein